MKYISTRGQALAASFSDIVLTGLAPDGGLYVPEEYCRVSRQELTKWRGFSYPELAAAIIGKFAPEIPFHILQGICDRAYKSTIFRYARNGGDPQHIAPLTWLQKTNIRNRPAYGIALLEISNGPTLAFKDIAMQFLAHLFDYILEELDQVLNVLAATSGDTGSAAEHALRHCKRLRVFMLSPYGKMSAFQRAQMYTLFDPNIFNLAVRGMFDDAQNTVKAVFGDADFKAQYNLGAVNSINWARIAAQVVYYFWGYFRATESNEEVVDYAVPTGNFGDIYAGHVAREMGLPIRKLIVATNENNVLPDFFQTARYEPRSPENTFVTSSPSEVISRASNFERFVFDLLDRDGTWVDALFSRGGSFKLDHVPAFQSIEERYGIVSHWATHEMRKSMIRVFHKQYGGLIIDPHTADGVAGAFFHYREADRVTSIVMETAQAIKFDDMIEEVLGIRAPRPAELQNLESCEQRFQVRDPDPEEIKRYIANHV